MSKSLGPEISFVTREHILRELPSRTYDLVILGGGINGAGAAREAALRGLKVLLVEAADFSEGTSSRSSKMIHGGIRYLENLEFGLVFESLSERGKLFELAPHLVHPLKFLLPHYRGARHPMWKLSLGMWLYDALSMFAAPEGHRRLSAKEIHQEHPYLSTEGLLGGFSYYDAYTDDDRLVLETLRSAAAAGADLLNYTKCEPEISSQNPVMGIPLRDQITGQLHRAQARHVVSTLGPWTDLFAQRALSDWRPILRPTKGIHLVFDRSLLPLKEAVVMNDEARRRIVFVLPRADYLLVGTTDTDFSGDPSEVRTEAQDVDYLLEMAAEHFPAAGFTRESIVSCYAGVRPLYATGEMSASQTSRGHHIFTQERVTFVTGGKFTTYRRMAQEAVDEALGFFPLEDRVKYQHSFSDSALNPRVTAARYASARRRSGSWAKEMNLPVEEMDLLVKRYGEEAPDILALAPESLPSRQRVVVAEALFALRHTGCLTPLDFLMRRTPHFWQSPDHGRSLWAALSATFADEMGLTDAEMSRFEEQYQKQVTQEFAALARP